MVRLIIVKVLFLCIISKRICWLISVYPRVCVCVCACSHRTQASHLLCVPTAQVQPSPFECAPASLNVQLYPHMHSSCSLNDRDDFTKRRVNTDFLYRWSLREQWLTKRKKISLLVILHSKIYFNILFFSSFINTTSKYVSRWFEAQFPSQILFQNRIKKPKAWVSD